MAQAIAQMVAIVALAFTAAGRAAEPASEPAPAGGACACCCEEITPRGSAPGIFNCGDCCGCCDDLRFYRSEVLGRLWMRGEYLAWSMKGQSFPSLVTTSLPGTPANEVGVPGLFPTMTLLGNERLLGEMNSGGRLTGGFWWTPEQYGGLEGSFFEVDAKSRHRFVGNSVAGIARPYLDVTTDQWASLLVAYPGLQNGSVDVAAETQFTGGEALLRQVVRFGESYRIDLVGGYRHAHLGDQLMITESMAPLIGYPANTYIDRFDLFRVQNDFHGGQAGVIARWRRHNVALQLSGKVSLGETVTHTQIDGGTAAKQYVGTVGHLLSSSSGGLLAQPSNIGRYRNTGFSSFEELGLTLDVQLTCTARAFFGYNLMYWSRVARVADQLDLGVNPTQMNSDQLVGASRPALDLTTTDFWAQGLNVGFEYQF